MGIYSLKMLFSIKYYLIFLNKDNILWDVLVNYDYIIWDQSNQ